MDAGQPLLLLPAGDRCGIRALADKEGAPLAFAEVGGQGEVALQLPDVDAAR